MPSESSGELVEIFDAQQESEAMVVKGLLESSGIEALVSGLDAAQEVLPGVGGVVIRVRPDQAEEARRVIAEHLAGPPDDDSDSSGEPAA